MPSTSHAHVRINSGFLSIAEKRALVWIAERVPSGINSDHLTTLGFAGMLAAGAAFWASAAWRPALLVAIVALAVNWFGDSLDGTVARVRHDERPRYGYYLDHVLDAAGICALMCGMGTSGVMSTTVALVVLIAYLLVSAEVFLATAVRGEFRMSFLNLGPTELRILLALGSAAAYLRPEVTMFGRGPFLLFDIGGCVAAAGLFIAFVTSAARNARALYREEPLRGRAATRDKPLTIAILVVVLAAAAGSAEAATLTADTIRAWDAHVAKIEQRIAAEQSSPTVPASCGPPSGTVTSVPGGLIHEWRGCIVLPGIALDQLLVDLQNPSTAWPHQPDVVSLRVTERRPGAMTVFIRMRRTKIVTVTYNTEHVVMYRRDTPTRASSRSVASRISEIDNPETAFEREKRPGEDRGFLWRLNSYWRYDQVNGGVRVELDSLTLSRGVPPGLGFLLQPIISGIARESMQRTLASITDPPSRGATARSAG
jgi:phosphatidylglycerophosphate synthase